MAAPDYVLGSVREALSYDASALMIYTGAPQNTIRIPVDRLKADQARQQWEQAGFEMDAMIVHAPYIINLANTVNLETYNLGVKVLAGEIERTRQIGARYVVLHPGASLTASPEQGLSQVAKGLDEVLDGRDDVCVCLETMAGKGSEVGTSFEQLASIISRTSHGADLGICLDTCHISDAGYDLADADGILDNFDRILGLDRLKVVHVNDSKNPQGAHKDRHANIGQGQIGFEKINAFVHNPRLKDKIFILETPYIGGHAPYGYEIKMLREGRYEEIPLAAD